MSYILLTADFPGVNSTQRTKIYECLKKELWQKVEEASRDISTVWFASFKDDITEARAIQIAIDDFEKCSKSHNCEPKLVIHWGGNRPTFHGLT